MNRYYDTVTVVHAPVLVGYGGAAQRDWANAVEVDAPASFQPETGSEDTDRRDVTITTAWVYTAAEVDAFDRVRWHGVLYEVLGEPQRWWRGGRVDHTEAHVQLVRESVETALPSVTRALSLAWHVEAVP